ncbi:MULTISPECIES: hypothetical protein [Kitasatospora]|uniref:Secreted protein n=1 Tax=Kitasatospora cystarginea TaxID=58350 RepID=A0ABN3EHS2_9ACTN
MKNGLKRSAARLAAAGVMGAAVIAAAATPALAKGAAELSAPSRVSVGQAIHIKGRATDDGATDARLCVQERSGKSGAWRTVKCGPMTVLPLHDATVDVKIKARHRATIQLRGVLYGYDGAKGGHPFVDRTTDVKVVHVR